MPVGGLGLRAAQRANVPIHGRALGTFARAAVGVAIVVVVVVGDGAAVVGRDGVEAALVEGVFAEEMDGGEVERGAAGGAAERLEHGRFGGEGGQFLSFGRGFRAIGFD